MPQGEGKTSEARTDKESQLMKGCSTCVWIFIPGNMKRYSKHNIGSLSKWLESRRNTSKRGIGEDDFCGIGENIVHRCVLEGKQRIRLILVVAKLHAIGSTHNLKGG